MSSPPARGYIFVAASRILAAQDESEFAGALAHAMIHIAGRHGSRPSAQTAQQETIPLVFVGGPRSDAVLPVSFQQVQKTFESETDLLAVKVMADAGFDPEGLASYIGRVQRDDARIQAIEEAIAALPQCSYTSLDAFARIKAELQALAPQRHAASLLK